MTRGTDTTHATVSHTPLPATAVASTSAPGSAYQPQRLWSWAVLAGLCVFVPWIWYQLPDLEQQSEYRLAWTAIELQPAPVAPVPTDLLERIAREQELPADLSLLKSDTVTLVARRLSVCPWIERVVQVQKHYPPRIVAEVQYRRPVAMVRVRLGAYPLDEHGVLLPPRDFSQTDATRYPRIDNISSIPQGPAGSIWSDPAVLAAVRLAGVLHPFWNELHLQAIVAPTLEQATSEPDDLLLELLTSGGSRVLWGRPPGSKHPGELTLEQKIGRLQQYLADHGQYEAPAGPYEIDIRHWQEMTRRPLPGRVADQPERPSRSRGARSPR